MTRELDTKSFFSVSLQLSDLNSYVSPAPAADFLFCCGGGKCCSVVTKGQWRGTDEDDGEDDKEVQHISLLVPRETPRRSLWQEPEVFSGAVTFFVPAAAVLAQQILSGGDPGGVSTACIPIAVPFSIPQVSSDVWCADKRALAFHRATAVLVYVQGGVAVLRFFSGDLVGGALQGLQTALGVYAIGPDGMQFFPSYIMMSGFNGLLGGLGAIQNFQGVPFGSIPLMPVVSPVVSLAVAYCGWQFCREVYAIASGAELGEQNSCFVKMMTPAWWPQSADTVAPYRPGEAEESHGATRFSAFTGSGHRLGQASA